MQDFKLLAQPWWVNLLILAPIIFYFIFRGRKFVITKNQLVISALFGIAFGLVEAAVVIYLRAALGSLPNFPVSFLAILPKTLFRVEFFREAATLIMLMTVAILTVKSKKERVAIFLWIFAFWDIFYYVWLWVFIRWPESLTTSDVLFLIPVPWLSQVWFPLLVSGLTLAVVWQTRSSRS
jgi:hypothetical protein